MGYSEQKQTIQLKAPLIHVSFSLFYFTMIKSCHIYLCISITPWHAGRDQRPLKSSVVGRPILLALEEIDGSPSFLEKALQFLETYGEFFCLLVLIKSIL